jgi:hypothetical protein
MFKIAPRADRGIRFSEDVGVGLTIARHVSAGRGALLSPAAGDSPLTPETPLAGGGSPDREPQAPMNAGAFGSSCRPRVNPALP